MASYNTYFQDVDKDNPLAESLANEWDSLLARSDDCLQLFTARWFLSWLESIGSAGRWTGRAKFIYVKENLANEGEGKLVGIAVIAQLNVLGIFSAWSFAGYYQPWRSIIADRSHSEAVGKQIAIFLQDQTLLVLQAGPLNTGLDCNKSFLSTLNTAGLVVRTTSEVPLCTYNHSTDISDYTTRILGKKLRKNIRYYGRKLQNQGKIRISHSTEFCSLEIERLLNDLKTVEQNSWLVKNSTGLPRFISETDQAFWKLVLASSCVPRHQLDVWVLYFDEKPISFCLTISCGNARHIIANQYDEEFREYMTGSILYLEMMTQGIQQGIKHFDFGDGGIEYKSKWGAIESDLKSTPYITSNKFLSFALRSILTLKKHIAG